MTWPAAPSDAEIAAAIARYTPLGVRELNIGDEWRARWVPAESLPTGAPVVGAYVAFYLDDKGYVVREKGTERWGVLEGAPEPGEQPLAFVKRVCESAGATAGKVVLIGYLDCRATTHNPAYPADTEAAIPLYVVAAKRVRDVPANSPLERRRLPLNEHVTALRNRYPQLVREMEQASQRYAVMRARGEL